MDVFGDENAGAGGTIEFTALHEATRHRYLNYALSVITSRALPDVRDGLKPCIAKMNTISLWEMKKAKQDMKY